MRRFGLIDSRARVAPGPAGAENRPTAVANCLLALSILAVPAAVDAQPARRESRTEAPPIEAAARESRSLVLAKLLLPGDLIVEREIVLAKRTFQAIRTGPRGRRLEAAYPGIHSAAWAEVEPDFRRLAIEAKPPLWARVAARLETLLTDEETEALIIFYSTPIGQRILQVTVASVDSYPDESRPPPADGPQVAARVGEIGELSAEDKAALIAARRAVSRDKTQAIGDEIRKLAIAWRHETEPGQLTRGDRIVAAAMRRQIARRRARR